MKFEEEILERVWREHLSNENNKHELKEHFCRACLDLFLELYRQKVKEDIDKLINTLDLEGSRRVPEVYARQKLALDFAQELKKELGLE